MRLDLPFGGLASADALAVLGGVNRIAIASANGGWEIIGFCTATEIVLRRWHLAGLLRGLAGTEDAMDAGHGTGAAVILLDDAVVPLGLSADEAGRPGNWIVEPVGLSGAGRAGPQVFAGGERALTPLAPVHLRAHRESGGLLLSWVRRGRIDADSWLSADIPLDEAVEAYRLDILAGGSVKRTVETAAPQHLYTAADEIADFGGPQTSISIRVRQLGRAVPLGLPARATLSL